MSAASPQHTLLSRAEGELHELCCWYEWSEPPDLEAAGVLQDAADAVRVRALSPEVADALIAVWQPFAGLEAQVGKQPEMMAVAENEVEFQRGIVAHMRRLVGNEKHPAKRVHLVRLLEEQIRNFEGGHNERHQQRVG
jgi:hypothetical protein